MKKEMAVKSIKETKRDIIFNIVNYTILSLLLIIIAYPLIFIVSSSFSDPYMVLSGRVWLLPIKPSLEGYKAVFNSKMIWSGYANSIMYAGLGTCLNIVITILAAYPLSRRDLKGRSIIMFVFTFTMFFSGGIIPTYLVVQKLGLINKRAVMVIPVAMTVWNMIITRTYFQSTIPKELLEASQIDSCNNTRFLLHIVLPLSKPVIAVIALFYAVWHWNSYFNALIYLRDEAKYPLQLVLRQILIQNEFNNDMMADIKEMEKKTFLQALLKYSLIVVASAPLMIAYPFVQKYFVKGVMIGAIKG